VEKETSTMKDKLDTARLYVVIDLELLGTRDVSHATRDSIDGGADMIQLRAKDYEEDLVEQIIGLMLQITRPAGIPLIVNDLVQVAHRGGADGAHVGQGDLDLNEARRIMGPDAILGASAVDLDSALAAEKAGADYLGLGAVFPTLTKADAEVVGLGPLREVHETVGIPVFAIGGIDATNVGRVLAAGGSRIAVIGAVLNAADVRAATAEMKAALQLPAGETSS
jgi:thiamine-phosphate pyrophosphorylase